MRVTRNQRESLFFAWVPAAIGVLAIFLESTDYLSVANTREFLQHIWAWFGISHQILTSDNHFLRKTGHFVGYGTLSLLFYRGRRRTGQILFRPQLRMVDVAFAFV